MNIAYLTAIEGFLGFCALVAIIVYFVVRDYKKNKKKREEIQRKIMMLDNKKSEPVNNEEDIERLPYRKKIFADEKRILVLQKS